MLSGYFSGGVKMMWIFSALPPLLFFLGHFSASEMYQRSVAAAVSRRRLAKCLRRCLHGFCARCVMTTQRVSAIESKPSFSCQKYTTLNRQQPEPDGNIRQL